MGSENMENLMTVVDRLDELQASSVGRRECSRTRQRTGARHMDVHDDACSSSSLSTSVVKFSIFWTPLANFLLSRPNSVEYGNSKTTTLLPLAKCMRPLFQG